MRRQRFGIQATVVRHGNRDVTTGRWFRKRSHKYDVLVVNLDVDELSQAVERCNGFRVLNGGYRRVPEQINVLSPVEDGKNTQFPIGSKVNVVFGYYPEILQWFTGATPLEVVDVVPFEGKWQPEPSPPLSMMTEKEQAVEAPQYSLVTCPSCGCTCPRCGAYHHTPLHERHTRLREWWTSRP